MTTPPNYAHEGFTAQTLRNAWIVTRREVRDSIRDWRIIIPIFLLTLVFPFLANVASTLFTNLLEQSADFEDTQEVLDTFLPIMPMLVGFFPVSISLVIALETFVGEKERQSLEPLLSTPLTNLELYLGKVMAAIIPPLGAGYLGISIYLSGQILAQGWRPDPEVIALILVLTTVQAIVMVTGAVVISSQTTSTRAANLLASAIIIPMSLLVIVESLIMIQPGERGALWYIALAMIVVIVLLIRTGTHIFRREELLGRSLDHINLAWAWNIFVEQWQSGVTTFRPLAWYRQSVFPAIRRLKPSMMALTVFAVFMFIGGWFMRDTYPLPMEEAGLSNEEVLENLRGFFEGGFVDPDVVLFIIFQNSRVIFLAIFLGMFSLGTAGLLLTTLPFGVLGYLFANLAQTDLNPLIFIGAVLPHGIVEIPAIMLAGAVALHLGAVPTRKPDAVTVGEAFIRQLADSIKIAVFVIFPMLILAAILEVYVTPSVVEWVLTIE